MLKRLANKHYRSGFSFLTTLFNKKAFLRDIIYLCQTAWKWWENYKFLNIIKSFVFYKFSLISKNVLKNLNMTWIHYMTLQFRFSHSTHLPYCNKFFKAHLVIKMEKAMATHSSTLAWEIPWMEEPGRLQSMGSQRVGHDWVTSLSLFTFMHWRRKWQPTPLFLPGESQGREPGGLPSMGSHRVRHDWCDLAAAVIKSQISK